MSTGKPPFWIVFKAHLRADARKTVALVVLFVVMIVVYARMFMSSSGPNEANAGVAVVAPASGTAIAAAATTLVAAPNVTAAGRVLLSQPIARDIIADPFAIDFDKYPLGHVPKTDPQHPVENAVKGDDPIHEEAKSLTLQSTVCGTIRIACISGQCLRQGEIIDGFVLERVEPNRVVLEREGVRVALFLK